MILPEEFLPKKISSHGSQESKEPGEITGLLGVKFDVNSG